MPLRDTMSSNEPVSEDTALHVDPPAFDAGQDSAPLHAPDEIELVNHQDLTGSSESNHEAAAAPDVFDAALPWYTYAAADAFRLTLGNEGTTGERGVDEKDVARNRTELGDNVIPISGGPNFFKMLLGQFCNAITLILGIVIVISAVFKDWAEFGVVVFVVVFNGLLGFYQEYGAEKSLQGLKEMTAGSAKVKRSGRISVIPIDEVVVGDVVILEQGASVPADLRLFEVSNLEIDEALLTGEALPVVKHCHPIPDPNGNCALGDRKNMAFRNTLVTQGRGKGIVVAGGLKTEMGKLADRLSNAGGSTKTELQKKLDYMMFSLFGVCVILAVIVFAANSFEYHESTLLYAAAVAVAILPESLFVVMTVATTMSVRRMASQRCIVRTLGALEVLGNVTDICSDKTGTLTENKMVVKTALVGVDKCFRVAGAPHGAFGAFLPRADTLPSPQSNPASPGVRGGTGTESGSFGSPRRKEEGVNMESMGRMYRDFFRSAAMCSTTSLFLDVDEPSTLIGKGNPTEVAIQVMTWKAGLNREYFEDEEEWEVAGEFPFDSSVKRMSVVCRNRKDPRKAYTCTKGAPERILNLCYWHITEDGTIKDITDADRATILANIDNLAKQGLRTICMAQRNLDVSPITLPEDRSVRYDKEHARESIEGDLIFLGVVGIFDPPRPESQPSINTCQQAGIRVRMLTGDHTSTACAIATTLGICPEGTTAEDRGMVMSGPELDRLSNEELDALPDLPVVVGRCSPESKVKMIEAIHRRGGVVAMTGDGFNDSPSIKIADIGCAMGSGTDVTKGVADIVITDDNFATIVKAVAEGRRIADAIRKFVLHLLSSNVAEVIILILGLPIQYQGRSVFILSPIEILWLNMFTGSPPATGLSLDEADENILHVPPNTVGFFTKELIADTMFYGLFLGTCSLLSFVFVAFGIHDGFGDRGNDCNSHSGTDCDVIWTARATAFSVLYIGLLLHAYNIRSPRKSVFRAKWFDNNWLSGSVAFGVVTLVVIIYVEPIATNVFIHRYLTWEWGVVAVAIIVFMALSEMYKVIKNIVDPVPIIVIPTRKRNVHRHRATETLRDGTVVEVESASEEEEIDPNTSPQLDVTYHEYTGDRLRNTSHIARRALRESFAVSASRMTE